MRSFWRRSTGRRESRLRERVAISRILLTRSHWTLSKQFLGGLQNLPVEEEDHDWRTSAIDHLDGSRYRFARIQPFEQGRGDPMTGASPPSACLGFGMAEFPAGSPLLPVGSFV